MSKKMYYNEFKYSDPSEKGIEGQVSNAREAIGDVTICFADLEDQLSTSISFVLQRGDEVGRIVTAELAFKNKTHLLASLFKATRSDSDNLGRLDELLGLCCDAEALRNQIVHSSWRTGLAGEPALRRKYTAKRDHGLKKNEETLTPVQIHEIALHCGYLIWGLDQLMYEEFGSEYGEP